MKTNDQTETGLCLSCGLCCNGTLYGIVELKVSEQASDFPSLPIVTKKGKTFFPQPCSSWSKHSGCGAYQDRPQTCRDYRCKLLKQYLSGDVSFDNITKKISLTQKLTNEVSTAIAARVSFLEPTNIMQQFILLFPDWDENDYQTFLVKENASIVLSFISFKMTIDKYFLNNIKN